MEETDRYTRHHTWPELNNNNNNNSALFSVYDQPYPDDHSVVNKPVSGF